MNKQYLQQDLHVLCLNFFLYNVSVEIFSARFLLFQVQLTDFENSAYVVFIVLLTRVILSYKLDFLIPLSKVRMWLFFLLHFSFAEFYEIQLS